MKYTTAYYTDVGTRKKTNQDSMVIMQAETSLGTVLMAAVCDGMGGLAKGEVASATMVRMLTEWFENELPVLIGNGGRSEELRRSWEELVTNACHQIAAYGEQNHVELGTTATVMLMLRDIFYIMNVGDSRAYMITDAVYQLTKDQTYVQQQVDMGLMTPQEAMMSPQKSVLLQCIGACDVAKPDFVAGNVMPGQVFMLCCDGFRHVIQPSEFYEAFHPSRMVNKQVMEQAAADMTRLNIARGEEYNISVILIKVEP